VIAKLQVLRAVWTVCYSLSGLPQWTGFFLKIESRNQRIMRSAGESESEWDSQMWYEHSTGARWLPHLHFHQKIPERGLPGHFPYGKNWLTVRD